MSLTTPASSTEMVEISDYYDDFPTTCDTEIFIIFWPVLIISLVGLVGNAIVFWLLGFRMRRSAIHVYILNLTAADIIILCLYLTLFSRVVSYYSIHIIYIVFLSVGMWAYITGLSMLSAISLERCLSALCPIWYLCHRPRHTSAILCALLWTLALMLTVIMCHYCEVFENKGDLDSCMLSTMSSASYLIILLVILCGSNLALIIRMFCGSHRIPPTRLFVTILITVLVFICCGLPFGINAFLMPWLPLTFSDFPCYYDELLMLLSCVNSSANPVIYFFIGSFRQQKRQNLRLVLQRALQDSPEREEGGGSLCRESLEMSRSSTPAKCL